MKQQSSSKPPPSQRCDKDFEDRAPSIRRRVVVDMDAEGNAINTTEYMFNDRLQRWESLGKVPKSSFMSTSYAHDEDLEPPKLNDSEQ